jgi:hypothetical protein
MLGNLKYLRSVQICISNEGIALVTFLKKMLRQCDYFFLEQVRDVLIKVLILHCQHLKNFPGIAVIVFFSVIGPNNFFFPVNGMPAYGKV